MKIIKEGVDISVDTKRFVCKDCGCVFEAENTSTKKEYEKCASQYQEIYYKTRCPCCHHEIFQY